MSRVDVNKYWCKLQLLRHGLLAAAKDLEDIGHNTRASNLAAADADSDDEENNLDGSSGEIMDQRRNFVRRKLKEAGVDPKRPIFRGDQTEVVAEARKAAIQAFYADIGGTPVCRNCQGVSPKYRKNKATSIFRKPPSAKDRARNAQAGLRMADNPLAEFNRIQKAHKKKLEKLQAQRAADAEVDEAVADMDDSSQDDAEIRILDGPVYDDGGEESDEEMADAPATDGSLLANEASTVQRKKSAPKDVEVQRYVDPQEIYASLSNLFQREREILSQVYGSGSVTSQPVAPSADMFFIKNLVVPPNKYRREQGGGSEITESADNAAYRNVLASCQEMFEIQRELRGEQVQGYTGRPRNFEDFQNAGIRLQDNVNSIIDKEKNPTTGAAAQRNPDGIKQKLEKKEGLFRMNIMGKRVNFAARSVISPDPNIESNEIGIPPVFAKKLTYPEPVVEYNFDALRQAVINGPDVYPGAAAVEYENGQIVNLRQQNAEERLAIANLLKTPSNGLSGAKNKKVHRHLAKGDIVIMNRQPTLHKPSMMCHKARVLPGEKTIRMHYANCKTYNADFDGDEMNMHFPQNELARAEAFNIANNDNQYLSATAGEPLRGLIQDHISISVSLTSLDCFFTREEYQELLYSCLRPEDNHTVDERIKLLDPDIIKPVERWTGKQVISTILLNIQPSNFVPFELTSRSSIPATRWGSDSEEGIVRFRDGLLVTGILDKKQIGPSAGGFIHTVYETYGPTVAGSLLSIIGRVLTRMLNVRAFSCGVEDLLLTPEGNNQRKQKLLAADSIGLKVASKFVSMEDQKPKANNKELANRLEQVLRSDTKQADLDVLTSNQASTVTSEITKTCLPAGLVKQFPKNQMQVMTASGAKGSVVNANLISCNLGQQVLEGRRVPVMVSGKTLPSFRPFDPSLRAGGYITDRFLTGVRPQEYYFHAMAGREGLIDTAVKTSRSGYLQRCLVKGLEGLRAEHDGSVRDSDGTMIQTLYGEDGLDVLKQASLTDFKLQFDNFLTFFERLRIKDELAVLLKVPEMAESHKAVLKEVDSLDLEASDPIISRFSPAANAGATSEKFWNSARAFFKDNKADLKRAEYSVKRPMFEKFISMNYLKAVVQAGEAVGVVAGQSLGEPSTQMTLNTFHLAGHAAKNVTLGIPRLREILMTASMKIKTPTMNLHPIESFSLTETKRLSKGISRLRLAEVIDTTSVKSRLGSGKHGDTRIYDVKLDLYPGEEYKEEHAIQIEDVARTIEQKFIPELKRLMKAELKKRGEEKDLASASDAQPEVGVSKRQQKDEQGPASADNEGGDSDEDEKGDDDATDAKSRANRNEETTYDDPEDEEEEVARSDDEGSNNSESEEDETYGGSEKGADTEEVIQDGEEQDHVITSAKEREHRIITKHSEFTAFSFDDKTGSSCAFRIEYAADSAKLLLLALVNRAAHAALIQSIPGIASATVVEPDEAGINNGEKPYVLTEGANLVAMRDYQHLINPQRIETNDIGAMLTYYGVEACRSAIMRELGGVFKGHSIDVDPRHLTLVADYMTRGGGYSPFNRMGMRDKTSPFMKMSFETTFGVLAQAMFDGDRDRLDSPSSRITVGKIGRMGTGMVDVYTPVPTTVA